MSKSDEVTLARVRAAASLMRDIARQMDLLAEQAADTAEAMKEWQYALEEGE